MPTIKQFNNDYIRQVQGGVTLLTRKQAEQLNDAILKKLEALPESMVKQVNMAIDRVTEAAMLGFDPIELGCGYCDQDVYPVHLDDPKCPRCGANLSANAEAFKANLDLAEPLPPGTNDLPDISQFKFEEPGDEQVLQILVDLENLKVRCPEDWDVWNHLSGAQEILMGIK